MFFTYWRVSLAILGITAFGHATSFAQVEKPGEALRLPDALAIALQNSPRLEAYSWAMRAAEARAIQAGLRPNPQIEIEFEEVRFSNGSDAETFSFDSAGVLTEREVEQASNSGLDESEITVSISQVFELGRKRAKQTMLAQKDSTVADWDYEVARADLLASVGKAFIRAYAAQFEVAMTEELADLAREMSNAIGERVAAGRVSPIDGRRAELERHSAEIRLEQARRTLASARRMLASEMGLAQDNFGPIEADLTQTHALANWSEIEAMIQNNPEIARWQAEIAMRESRVELERALRWPDLTVSAGWRTEATESGAFQRFDGGGAFSGSGHTSFEDDRENTFLVTFSLPLPLFDRNQGNVMAAEHMASRTRAEARHGELSVRSTLYESWQRAKAAEREVKKLERDIVPTAEAIFAAADAGYREGKFGYLDVLDAQRTLSSSRAQLVAAQVRFHEAAIDVERLTGAAFASPHQDKNEV